MAIRRAIRRLLIALPPAAWLLANLWLECPSGRNRIAALIQQATGLETRIGGASFTPWRGVSLYQVTLLQPAPLRATVPQPLARIGTIRLTPVWRLWLHGKPAMRIWQIDTLRLVVPVEILAEIARAAPPAAAPPALAAANPPTVAPPAAGPPAAGPPAAGPPAAGPPAARPPAAPPVATRAPAVSLPPTVWLQVIDASFTLMHASSGRKMLEMSGLEAAIPYDGKPAQTTLRIHSLAVADQAPLTDLAAVLDWQAPVLSLKPLTAEAGGLKCIIAAKVAMLHGIPLQVEAALPNQALAPVRFPDDGHAEAGSVAASARFRGLLLAPGSWQGELVAEATAISAHLAGHDAKFDRGGVFAVMRGATLACPDARLVGDDLSLLGNATVTADGQTAAVLRLVAPPETLTTIARHVFPNTPQAPALTPLASPQRAALDLEVSGSNGQLSLRLGREGPVISH